MPLFFIFTSKSKTMKKALLFLIALALLFSASCDLIDEITEKENELNGETDIPLNETGNTFSPVPYINGTYSEIPTSITITESTDGLVTLDIVIDLQNEPSLAQFNNMIPAEYKDSQGRINTQGKVKITSEGFLDYTNIDNEPHTLVKYNCKVGDTYKIEKSDGNTITRTVTQKSTEDDFSYGFYMIKTITVEQDSRIPGIQKIVYKFNHKFGLVAAEVVAEDGSNISSLFYPSNY
jgi:hypothetical protein